VRTTDLPPTATAAARSPAKDAAAPRRKPGKPSSAGKPAGAAKSAQQAATAPGRPPPRHVRDGGAPRPRERFGPKAAFRPEPVTAPKIAAATRPAVSAPPTIGQAAAPDHEHPRLSKLMTERGLCSRREADEWIENGWVRVDGQVMAKLGTRVAPDVRIEIDPTARQYQSERVTILLNKPVGYVSGQAEEGYKPAIVLITPENRWAEDRLPRKFVAGHLRGLAPAGRLDIDSTGLLVLTQDGRVAKRLIGEDSPVEKEYLVRVEGKLSPGGLELLNHGLELDGRRLKPARVSWQNEHQLRFVLREGRKRQIRRMCELVGLTVTGLKRVRSGGVALGKLPVGKWRYLRPDESF
jgi:23S rRNA pseudouridine2604 synthase